MGKADSGIKKEKRGKRMIPQKHLSITITATGANYTIEIENPQLASKENGNIGDMDFALKILEKWDTENVFLLRENMELVHKGKGINSDVLENLCFLYDLEYKAYPENEYEGYSLLHFFFKTMEGTEIPLTEDEWRLLLLKAGGEKGERRRC